MLRITKKRECFPHINIDIFDINNDTFDANKFLTISLTNILLSFFSNFLAGSIELHSLFFKK
jgi:hypothetical protein